MTTERKLALGGQAWGQGWPLVRVKVPVAPGVGIKGSDDPWVIKNGRYLKMTVTLLCSRFEKL